MPYYAKTGRSHPLIVGLHGKLYYVSKQVQLNLKQEGHMDLNEYVNILLEKF
jgi:hypothetical protein